MSRLPQTPITGKNVTRASRTGRAKTASGFSMAAKITLLVLSVLPLYAFVGLCVFIVALWLNGTPSFRMDTGPFFLFVSAVLIFPLFAYGLAIWYIVFLTRNAQIDTTAKIVWAIVLIQFNALALPVFWYLYIWKPQSSPRPT